MPASKLDVKDKNSFYYHCITPPLTFILVKKRMLKYIFVLIWS